MDGFSSYGSGTTQNDSYKGFQTEEINVADIPTPKSSNTTQGSSSGGICASAQPVKYDIPVQPEPKPAETTYENYQESNTMAAYSFADAPYYTAINTLARTNTPPPPGVDYEEFRCRNGLKKMERSEIDILGKLHKKMMELTSGKAIDFSREMMMMIDDVKADDDDMRDEESIFRQKTKNNKGRFKRLEKG